MATVGMKHVEVLGPADLHRRMLDTLQTLEVMEIRRIRRPVRTYGTRRALLRLLDKVKQAQKSGYPAHQPEAVPDDLVAFARRLFEERERLEQERARLERALDRQRVWGNASPDQLAALSELNVHVQCWVTRDRALVEELQERNVDVWVLEHRARGQLVFCTVVSGAPLALEHAHNIAPPITLRADLERRHDEAQRKIATIMGVIVWLAETRQDELVRQIADAHDLLQLDEVRSEIHLDEHVFALTGWAPESRLDEVLAALSQLRGVTVRSRDPLPDEDPPTLTEYPVWARPIQAVFEFMGYTPGYREYDAGHLIVVFFTAFSALLINDGGYGLLILLVLLAAYRPLAARAGRNIVHLGLYVALATAVFGIATGALFGVQLQSLGPVEFIKFDTNDMIEISFALGIIHLSVGRLMRVWSLGPQLPAVAELGWLAIFWGVYLAIVNVFTGSEVPAAALPLVVGGSATVVAFSYLDRGLVRGPLLGLGLLLGSATTVFSDVMSYIRLMAVGFASMSLAMTTNTIAGQVGEVFAIPILVLGHTINLGLGMIALFVHGLRLNTLEFARQLGVQWNGRIFAPLSKIHLKTNSG